MTGLNKSCTFALQIEEVSAIELKAGASRVLNYRSFMEVCPLSQTRFTVFQHRLHKQCRINLHNFSTLSRLDQRIQISYIDCFLIVDIAI